MVDALVGRQMQEVLLANDQLNSARLTRAAFTEFIEGDITFRPTYKYDNNTDTYDSSAKARIPSYTDRILWKPTASIGLLHYDSVDSVKSSDHRPVYATFKVKVKTRPETQKHTKSGGIGGQAASRACVVQ
jgi:hypothetical protein